MDARASGATCPSSCGGEATCELGRHAPLAPALDRRARASDRSVAPCERAVRGRRVARDRDRAAVLAPARPVLRRLLAVDRSEDGARGDALPRAARAVVVGLVRVRRRESDPRAEGTWPAAFMSPQAD